jgi:isoleucyl-tRNA synthetase
LQLGVHWLPLLHLLYFPFVMFESQYPADFISEGIDQSRGWFSSQVVLEMSKCRW